MALFWIWLCVSAALVAVTCAGHHHTRHQHRRRSHPGDYNYLADFRLNDSSRASLAPQASIAPPAEPERGRSGGRPSTTKRQEWRARQRQSRGRQRRRPDGTRRHLPELVYSFGNQMAPSLYYRGSEYRTGKYSGHVDVWTIPRQSPVHKPALQEDNRIARVVIAPDYVEKESCLRCPKDQTIFVEPGFSCTQVPKPKLRPCARWTSFPDKVAMTATLGPQPGSLVMEGVYVMRFTFQAGATLPQSCQYQLRVKVLRCPPLTAPDNGGLRCSQGRHWGSRCRFFCLRGFSLSERSVTRCVIKGRRKATWTPHPAPRCSAHQKATDLPQGPSAVPVSTVTSSSDSVGVTPSPSTSTTPGLRTSTTRPPARKRWKQLACRWPKSREGAWLRCDHGRSFKRRIVAKEGTRCQEKCYYPEDTETVHFHCVQGAWRGRRDLNCTNRRLEGCLLPATPKHAELECPGETPREQRVSPGAVCLYRCKKDYDIVMTDPSHRSLECLLDASQWNHTVAPVCKKTGCESPSPLSHSTLDCSQGLTSVNTFPPGTTCEHVCDEGFTIPGSQLGLSQVTCSRDGSWNQTQGLLCVEMEVPQLSEGCRDDTLLVHSRNVSFPIPIAAPVFKGFNDSNAMVHCSMAELSDYGTHTNNCTATDTELGTVSWCTHNITVIASGCPSFDSDPYSRVSCSEDRNATEDMLHPVGDVCEYICELGYVIPRSRQDWAAKECMPNGAWSNDNFHLCQRHQNPQLSRGCEDYTVVVDNLTVSFPVPVSAPVFKAFNDTEAAVNCSLPQVIAYGTHMSNCTATDAELGTVSSCTFSVIVKAPGCPPLSSDPFSLVSCSEVRNATEDQFHPVGDVCEHNCQPGYVIPKGKKEWSTKTCLSNGTWSNDITHLCQKHQNPQLSRGCEDYTVVVDNLTVSFPVPVSTPVFKAFNDTEAAVNCSLPQVTAYGTHVSSCTATDAELGTVSSCTFSVIVKAPGCPPLSSDPFSQVSCSEVRDAADDQFHPVGDVCQHNCQPGYVIPKGRQEWSTKICLSNGTWSNDIIHLCQKHQNPQLSRGCQDYTVVVDNLTVSFPVPVSTPVFKAFNDTEAAVNCSLPQVIAYGTHVSSCTATDAELGTVSSCTFSVIVEAPGCPPLSSDPFSLVSCSEVRNAAEDRFHPVGDVCQHNCQPGYVIPKGRQEWSTKICLSNGTWSNDIIHLCQKQLAPVRVSGCVDIEVGTDDLSNVTVPTPVYRGGSGDPVEVLCSPGKLDDFGEHRIECRAEDQELKTSVSCTFKVIVKGETLPRLSEWSSGCVDVEQVHDSFPVVLKTPDFVSSSGDAAVVTCTPSSLHGPGTYNVSCTAKDNKSQAETQCDYVVNARQFAPFRESRCLSLEAPVNGNIMCRRRAGLVTCRFRCADGYTIATDEYPLLSRGYVECTQGVLFDFQEAYGLKHLPQCTRLPSPTYFEGSIMFYVGLPNCSAQSLHVDFVPTVVAGLLNRTGDICLQAKCDNITFVCETFRNVSDPSVHSPAMKVVWTIQAKHNVNSDDDGVPPAEGLIEDLQVLSHQIITSDAEFYREIAEVGGQLWQQSFQQSQFSLVCGNEGFTIDHDSGHCVECPTGTFEENRACHPCPKNHYQDVEGQTSCKPCPKHSFSEAGARSADNCTGLGWLEAPEPARDEPAVRVGSDRSPCKPNPCLHQGVCYLQKDGFSCLCTESYRGIRCESARP
ncbi:uncharacterized protein LOC8038470 isoform X1 [Ixodes scapularis]|uniref:uncharacterized protein LOC8038470 isoform X1 n=1 Tax=Ixodes scapularis TaxID=6945 RepID=UPI001C381F9B|nr:uncharacterized protein LOC8038470 isoform X1 [Ixodes scapularis]